jgi:hypothetical protein
MASLIASVTSGGPMFFVIILVLLLALTLFVALRQPSEPDEAAGRVPQQRHGRPPEPLPRRVPPVMIPEPDAAYMGRHGRDAVGPPVTIDRLQVPGSPPWQPALKPPEVS